MKYSWLHHQFRSISTTRSFNWLIEIQYLPPARSQHFHSLHLPTQVYNPIGDGAAPEVIVQRGAEGIQWKWMKQRNLRQDEQSTVKKPVHYSCVHCLTEQVQQLQSMFPVPLIFWNPSPQHLRVQLITISIQLWATTSLSALPARPFPSHSTSERSVGQFSR